MKGYCGKLSLHLLFAQAKSTYMLATISPKALKKETIQYNVDGDPFYNYKNE
jgi:hypothetical protein